MHLPKRRLENEMQFILDLADELGHGIELQQIEFGEKHGHESIAPLRNIDVMVGVHGAGLTWSAFLPQGRSALVEIFTHDLLPSSNKNNNNNQQQDQKSNSIIASSPYRKIAGWAGIEYNSVVWEDTKYADPPFNLPFPGEQRELVWNEEHVKKVADV